MNALSVLAVMEATLEQISNDVYPEDAEKAAKELTDARAAVAELIEAAKDCEWRDSRSDDELAFERLRAALARVGGAA